jgi:hypothetical protein
MAARGCQMARDGPRMVTVDEERRAVAVEWLPVDEKWIAVAVKWLPVDEESIAVAVKW